VPGFFLQEPSMTTKQPSATDRKIAKRLRLARITAGITQSQAAEHVEVSFQQVQKYETGTNRITAGCLALLAQVYGRPVGWFFESSAIDIRREIAARPVARARAAAKMHEALK
jgi:transcriptional regulator with XRE-family HTH domain